MYDAVGMHRGAGINILQSTKVPQVVDDFEEVDDHDACGGMGSTGIASISLR